MSTRINVSNEIVTWAIARAGYDLPVFIEKFPPVRKWLDGVGQPTTKQLQDFSKKVHLPFGYLLLPSPPEEELPIPYFRTNVADVDEVSINVYDTILLMEQRQDWLSGYLRDNDFEPLSFVGRYYNNRDVDAIVNDIRDVLGLPENWASGFKTWTDAQNHLVEVIEDRGIIVTFNGVVGNNTKRKIPVDECRGFVLVDEFAPFMFVNNQDFKSAQMFTIAHELAHVWTGRSAGFDFRKLMPADDPIEKLCDRVAAEFLVPEHAFNEAWQRDPNTSAIARHFKVSEIVAARRALDTGKWTKDRFFEFYTMYKRREYKKKEGQPSGGDFFATAKKRISITFAGHVSQAVKSNQLLHRDAYKLTGMKGDTYEKFFSKY